MDHQPMIRNWDEAEQWLPTEARGCMRRGRLPASMAVAFHERRTSMMIETPEFRIDTADAITDVLCRTLAALQADQILVVLPGAYALDPHGDEVLCALRALLGVRDRGWRHLLYPLLFDDPTANIAAIAVEPTDPWTARIRQVFDPATADLPFVSTVPPADDGFLIAAPPDSPFAEVVAAHGGS